MTCLRKNQKHLKQRSYNIVAPRTKVATLTNPTNAANDPMNRSWNPYAGLIDRPALLFPAPALEVVVVRPPVDPVVVTLVIPGVLALEDAILEDPTLEVLLLATLVVGVLLSDATELAIDAGVEVEAEGASVGAPLTCIK
jgi:hypothetical protein